MRSLFSTLEDRLPSHGAFLVRAILAVALIVRCAQVYNGSSVQTIAPHVIAAAVGLLLLFGLWTPVAGAIVAIIELFIAFSENGDPSASLLLAGLSISIALLGPGAWSVDARRFGLKRIEIRRSDE
jgi:putative oxidoreductase